MGGKVAREPNQAQEQELEEPVETDAGMQATAAGANGAGLDEESEPLDVDDPLFEELWSTGEFEDEDLDAELEEFGIEDDSEQDGEDEERSETW